MEKDEAVKLLEKKGYKTIYDHGVPIVLTSGQITKKMYSEIEELLHSNGYASSFGVRGNYKIEETGNYEETEIYESDDDMDDDIIEDMIEEKEEASMSDLTEIINSDDAVQLTFDSFLDDFDTP